MINCCISSQAEKFIIRSTLWRIFLKAIPDNQNYCEWIDKVNEDRKIFKEKLKEFNNFKKMSGDPLGGINQSDVILYLTFRVVGILSLKIMNLKN